ncbi:MAG: NUDIX domain-containing protein [Pseudomonadota bacterium]
MRMETDITVAALAEQDGRFLLVRERAGGREVLNQPGGHIERGETPEAAIAREVCEETGYGFQADGLLGVYLWEESGRPRRHLRLFFSGRVTTAKPTDIDDPNIVSAGWYGPGEIRARRAEHRYPFVERALADYRRGPRGPVAAIADLLPLSQHLADVTARAVVV